MRRLLFGRSTSQHILLPKFLHKQRFSSSLRVVCFPLLLRTGHLQNLSSILPKSVTMSYSTENNANVTPSGKYPPPYNANSQNDAVKPLPTDAQNSCTSQNSVTQQKKLRTLFPPIQPYSTGRIQVSSIHELYYEQVGNPKGNPVLFLHGGPGGGLVDYYRQFFDPEAYHVVLFDQRGSGKSSPWACLEENTTWHLVEDIEKLRNHLGIEKWIVFGGSWGSTLALAYAETHPNRVKALILRGIFACREKELRWFYQEGASFVFPDAWEKYIAPIPVEERGDFIRAYHKRLTGGDNEEEKLRCALAWTGWEMATSRLYVDPESIARGEDPKFAIAFARIENHYFINKGFLKSDNQLIDNAHILKDIPGVIVQGRYDMVCPMITAWELHKAWPKAELIIVPDAGHSAKEPGIIDSLIYATEKFKTL